MAGARDRLRRRRAGEDNVHVTRGVVLFLSAFLASGVEMVEALTIVLAVGTARGWRSTLFGAGAATLVLAAIIAVLGPAVSAVPLTALRLIVGGLLLIFGLQWLRKAILRGGGYKPLHDEAAIYEKERAEAQRAVPGGRESIDWYSFTVSFKGVFLEGLEVAFIVVTFGAAQPNGVAIATAAAAAALVIVGAVGAIVRAPLSRVPENTLKFAVGVMLTSFGTFWAGEGAGVKWPGEDASLLGILALLLATALLTVRVLRRRRGLDAVSADPSGAQA
jgi:uncharacterized membrane protein